MSRFKKLSHTILHCQYYITWVPKYILRILVGEIGQEKFRCTCACSEQNVSILYEKIRRYVKYQKEK